MGISFKAFFLLRPLGLPLPLVFLARARAAAILPLVARLLTISGSIKEFLRELLVEGVGFGSGLELEWEVGSGLEDD